MADDDPQLLRLIGRNLTFEGYDVLTISDGELALEEIKRSVPDLVLLDVMMPRIDGFTVCQRVREFSAATCLLPTRLWKQKRPVRKSLRIEPPKRFCFGKL